MLTNNHMSKYKDSIDIELVKLYDNLNKLDKKTQKMEEIGKVRMELYERNKIEQEEMLLEQKKLWEQKIEEERKRREDKENIEKRIEEAELEAERKRLDEYIANIDE
jgi:hypothetical protein